MMEAAELIRRAGRKDGDAVTQLVSQHEVAIRSYAAKVAPRPDMAEDIAQDAFVQALKSLHKFKEGADFGLWMKGIVRNMARRAWDRLYRDRKLARDSLAEYVEELAAGYDDGEDTEIKDRYLIMLRRCIEKLSVKSAELVKLRYQMEMKCSDIADRIHASVAAVKMALTRVRNGLRKCVRRGMEGSSDAV